MAAPEVHHLFHNPIADHSFSADHTTLAVARDSTVELYGKAGNAFKLKDVLKGHDKTVTSVDIAPNSGRIVSCSQGVPRPCPLYNLLFKTPEWLTLLTRPKCARLGAFSYRIQAHAGPSPNQPRRHLRPMVAF